MKLLVFILFFCLNLQATQKSCPPDSSQIIKKGNDQLENLSTDVDSKRILIKINKKNLGWKNAFSKAHYTQIFSLKQFLKEELPFIIMENASELKGQLPQTIFFNQRKNKIILEAIDPKIGQIDFTFNNRSYRFFSEELAIPFDPELRGGNGYRSFSQPIAALKKFPGQFKPAATTKIISHFTPTFGQKITCHKFLDRGKKILAGNSDGHFKIWDVNSGKEIAVFEKQKGPVIDLQLSPDQSHFLSISKDHSIGIWNIDNRKKVIELNGPNGKITKVLYFPDGKKIASISEDGTMVIWDLLSGNPIHSFPVKKNDFSTIAISPDGLKMASGHFNGQIKIWDTKNFQEILSIWHNNTINSLDFSPRGDQLVSGSNDLYIKLWDTNTGTELRHFKGHSGHVQKVQFYSKGSKILSVGRDETRRLWSVGQEFQIGKLTPSGIKDIEFSPDELKIVSSNYSGDIELWNTEQIELMAQISGEELSNPQFSPDGSKIIASNGNHLTLWKITEGLEWKKD